MIRQQAKADEWAAAAHGAHGETLLVASLGTAIYDHTRSIPDSRIASRATNLRC